MALVQRDEPEQDRKHEYPKEYPRVSKPPFCINFLLTKQSFNSLVGCTKWSQTATYIDDGPCALYGTEDFLASLGRLVPGIGGLAHTVSLSCLPRSITGPLYPCPYPTVAHETPQPQPVPLPAQTVLCFSARLQRI
jgi:hypothetical protein